MQSRDYPAQDENDVQERRKIVVRVIVAVGFIVVLLAVLLFLGNSATPAKTETSQVVTRGVDIGVTVKSSAPALPPEVQQAIKNAPDATQAALAAMSAPVVEAVKPAPVVSEGTSDPSVKPILNQPADVNKGESKPAPRTGKPLHVDRLLVDAPAPTPVPATPAPVSVPKAAVSPTPPPAPEPAFVGTGFVVQLGVFNNVSNAEDLRAKLKQAGIPSQLETRVQVGPFTSKEEAVRAQDKLRTLGLGHGMLVSAAKKP